MHYFDLIPTTGLACIVPANSEDKPTGRPRLFDVALPTARADFDTAVAASVASRRGVFVCYYTMLDRARLSTGKRDNAAADASYQSLVCDVDVDPSKPDRFATQDQMVEALLKLEDVLPVTACVHSGGGAHLYWKLDTPLAHGHRIKAQDALRGLLMGVDARLVGDPRRMRDAGLLRAPGSRNFKAHYGPSGAPVDFWWSTGPTYALKDLLGRCASATPSPSLTPEETAHVTALAATSVPASPIDPAAEGRFQRASYTLSEIATKCELFKAYTLDHMRASPHRTGLTRNDGAAWEAVLQLGAFVKDGERVMHAYAHSQDYATPDDERTISSRLAGWRTPPSCRRMRETLLGMDPAVAGVATNAPICARCPLTRKSDKLNNTPLDAVDYDVRADRAASVLGLNSAPFTLPASGTASTRWLDDVDLNAAAGLNYATAECPLSPAHTDALTISDDVIKMTRVVGKTVASVLGFRQPEIPLLQASGDREVVYVIGRLAPGQPAPVGMENLHRYMEAPRYCAPVMTRSEYRRKMMEHTMSSNEDASRVFNALGGLAAEIGKVSSRCELTEHFTLPACRVLDSGDVRPTLWVSNPGAILNPGFVGTFDAHRAGVQWVFDHASPPAALAAIAAFASPLFAMLPDHETTPVISLSGVTSTGKSVLARAMGYVWDSSESKCAYQDLQAGATANALQALVQKAGALPLYADELRFTGSDLAASLMGLSSGGVKSRMDADANLRHRNAPRKGVLISTSNVTDLYDMLCRQSRAEILDAAMARLIHININQQRVFSSAPPDDLHVARGVFGANYAVMVMRRRAEIEGRVREAYALHRRDGTLRRFDVLMRELARVACDLLRDMGLRVDTVLQRTAEALDIAHGERVLAERRVAAELRDKIVSRASIMTIAPARTVVPGSSPWRAYAPNNGRITAVRITLGTGGQRVLVSMAAIDVVNRETNGGHSADLRKLLERCFTFSAAMTPYQLAAEYPCIADDVAGRMVDQYFELL